MPHLPLSNLDCPRGGIDPIDSRAKALAVVDHFRPTDDAPATVGLLLDKHHRGISVVVFENTWLGGDVVGAAGWLRSASQRTPGVVGAIIVSLRPHTNDVSLDDIDRWCEMCDLMQTSNVALLDWLVVLAGEVVSPRDLWAEPPRWQPYRPFVGPQ